MDDLPPLWRRIRKYFVHCVHFHADCTQFSNYFQDNYIPHFSLCQQFRLFSHLRQDIFGAMHTLSKSFLYILSIRKIQVNSNLLTKY